MGKTSIFKRTTALFLALIFMLSCLTISHRIINAEGTDDNVKFILEIDPPDSNAIEIYTAQDLWNVRNNLSGSYVLMNDIDLSSINNGEWIPIGDNITNANRFTGIFDGQGHIIENLVITNGNYEYIGLFGYVSNATIKNVGMEKGYINIVTSKNSYIGNICGFYYASTTINNCYNMNDVSVSSDSPLYVGGLVGGFGSTTSSNSSILNCYNMGKLSIFSTSSVYSGGILGYSASATTASISNCYNAGYIYASSSSSATNGGICGRTASPQISNCYNTGDVVSVSSDNASTSGGICGFHGSTIKNCYNAGNIQSSGATSVWGGGICGQSVGATLSDCYNLGDISCYNSGSSSYTGGICGFPNRTSISNCYNTGELLAFSSRNISLGGIYASYLLSNSITSSNTINNCYCLTRYQSSYGTNLTPEQMIKLSSFVGFDFINVWDISPSINNGLPFLRNMPTTPIIIPEELKIIHYSPANKQIGLATDINIKLTFNYEIDGDLSEINLKCLNDDSIVRCNMSIDGNKLIITSNELNYGSTYYIEFLDGIIYEVDNEENWAYGLNKNDYSFTIIDSENEGVNYKFNYFSPYNNDDYTQGDFRYSDSWFFDDNGRKYNHKLARTSLSMAMSAFGSTKNISNENECTKGIKDFFNTINFNDLNVSYPYPTLDSIGYAIGSKEIIDPKTDEQYTLIAVAIRGGGYASEWASNFTIGLASEHQGFSHSADEVFKAVKTYISNNGFDKNIKIWISGYSRGGAVANITASYLNLSASMMSIKGLKEENIYAYCFECPNVTSKIDENSTLMNNIHNIVNDIDIVPKVAPKEWGFTRYGITYFVPSARQTSNYNRLKNAMVHNYVLVTHDDNAGVSEMSDQGKFTDDTVKKMANFFGSQHHYVSIPLLITGMTDEEKMREIGKQMGQEPYWGDKVVTFFTAIKYGYPLFAIRHLATVLDIMLVSGETIGKAHYPELSLAWMNTLDGKNEFVSKLTRQLVLNCPIDVSVYENNVLVAQIIDDIPVEVDNSLISACLDDNGQKIFFLPIDGEYEIKITATDGGTMTYSVQEYDLLKQKAIRAVNYYELEISEGDSFTGIVENLNDVTQAEYPLYDSNNERLNNFEDLEGESEYCEINILSQGNGITTSSGLYAKGEKVTVMAETFDNEEFLGWYENGQKIDEATEEYVFLVMGDRTLEARFTSNTTTVTPSTNAPTAEPTTPTINPTSAPTVNNNPTTRPTQSTERKETVEPSPTTEPTATPILTEAPSAPTEEPTLNIEFSKENNLAYVFGYPDGTIKAENNITRAEIAQMLYNLAVNENKDQYSQQAIIFTDVQSDTWYSNPIGFLAMTGIISGYPNGTFKPDNNITRAELATILSKLAPLNLSKELPFTDVQKSHWGYDYIKSCFNNAWIVGYPDNTFKPDNDITRAEAIAMINKFLGRDVSATIDGDVPFSDLDKNAWYYKDVIIATGK